MKRILNILFLLTVCACSVQTPTSPNGDMTSTEVMPGEGFSGIYADNGIIVSLRKSDHEKITILGDSNIIPYVEILKNGSNLYVRYTEEEFATEPNLKIYIDYTDLEKISAENGSIVEIENSIDAGNEEFEISAKDRAAVRFMYGELFNCSLLHLCAEDESSVSLAGTAERYQVKLEEDCEVIDFNFQCNTMSAYVESSHLDVICHEVFSLTAFNGSKVHIRGGAEAQELHVSEDSTVTY